MIILLQLEKQALAKSGRFRRHKLKLLRLKKLAQQRNNVLRSVVFEVSIPQAPLNFRGIEVNLIDSFDALLGRHVGNTGQTLVANLGKKALVTNLQRPADAICVAQIILPNRLAI